MLNRSSKYKEKAIETLARYAEVEVKVALLRIAKEAGLRNRKIDFVDAMGSCTIDIQCRSGGKYVINHCDFWCSGAKAHEVHVLTYVDEHNFPPIKEFQKLLDAYGDVAGNLFALEFSINV